MHKNFIQNLFFKKTIIPPTEIDKIFSFLASVTHHPDTIENYLFQYNKLKKVYRNDDSIFINLYLNWEEFIINNKTENYKNFSSESLRKTIIHEIKIENISNEFKLVFLTRKEQTVKMYEVFIIEIIEYVNTHLGHSTLVKTIRDLKDPFLAKIKITPNGLDFYLVNQNILSEVQNPINEITKSFKNLVGALYGKIELSLGENLTKNTFNKMFMDLKEKYNAELATVVLKIIPEKILGMDEWLSLMSKKELERQVLEKTDELVILNNSLEKTISERTEELRIAYNNLKKLDEKKSEFISIAAHQLRTPLSAIKWGLAMMRNDEIGKITQEQKDFIDKNIAGNNKVIELVNDLLDIDLYTKDEKNYQFYSTNLVEIIEEVIKSVAPLSIKRNIRIEWKRPTEKILVEVDSKKISIVMQNLIDNAIKYSDLDSKIYIDTKKINSLIQISVKNTGIGIPKEETDDIFQRFFRAKNAIRKETEGMGVGLFITKKIIEDHEGRIRFDSKKDGETTFYVELPLNRKV
jgi:signal transduction histidine kinase